MSYNQIRPQGLGTAELTGCNWSTRDDTLVEHGQTWRRIGVQTAAFRALEQRLRVLKFPTGLFGRNRDLAGGRLGIEAGLYGAWMRFGGRHQWWVCNLTSPCDDGVKLDHGCAVRVHVDLHRVVMGQAVSPIPAQSAWYPTTDTYVRIVGGTDPLYRDGLMDVIVGRLIECGFLPPLERGSSVQAVTTRLFAGDTFDGGDAGMLIGINNPPTGLWQAFNVLQWPGKSPTQWPSGVAFGPTTRGRELRIHPEFLKALLRPTNAEMIRLRSTPVWRKTGTFTE
jgi:hypothetical protein